MAKVYSAEEIEKMSLLEFILDMRGQSIPAENMKQYHKNFEKKFMMWKLKQDYSHGEEILNQIGKLIFGNGAVEYLYQQELLSNDELRSAVVQYLFYYFYENKENNSQTRIPLTKKTQTDIARIEKMYSNLNNNPTGDTIVGIVGII